MLVSAAVIITLRENAG